jgi:hypothetical protein
MFKDFHHMLYNKLSYTIIQFYQNTEELMSNREIPELRKTTICKLYSKPILTYTRNTDTWNLAKADKSKIQEMDMTVSRNA